MSDKEHYVKFNTTRRDTGLPVIIVTHTGNKTGAIRKTPLMRVTMRARSAGDPLTAAAGNFLRTVPFAALLSLLTLSRASLDAAGVGYAVASGAVASGMGYAIWYTALPALGAVQAATVQLSVPVIAALGGIALLGEALTLRLVATSVAILGGIALVIADRPRPP